MRFEEIYGRFQRDRLSCEEAADLLGVSLSSFRRRRLRYETEGLEGLYDRRLGKVSSRRAPVDEVAKVLELFEEIRLVPEGGELRIELFGQLAALIGLANEQPRRDVTGLQVTLVAGARNHLYRTREKWKRSSV